MDRAARILVEGGACGGFPFWVGVASGLKSCRIDTALLSESKIRFSFGSYFERDDQ